MSVRHSPKIRSFAPGLSFDVGVELFIIRSEIQLPAGERDPAPIWGSQLILASFCSDEFSRLQMRQLTTAFDEAVCESLIIDSPTWVPAGVSKVLEHHRDGTFVLLAIPKAASALRDEIQSFVDVLRRRVAPGEIHFVALESEPAQHLRITGVNSAIRLGCAPFGASVMEATFVLAAALAPRMIIDIDWFSMAAALGDWSSPSFIVVAIWQYGSSELIFESSEAREKVRWSSAVIAVPQSDRESFAAGRELTGLVPLGAGANLALCFSNSFFLPWHGPAWAAPVRMLCRP